MKALSAAALATLMMNGGAVAADAPKDTCGAAQHQSLVGQPVSAIPRSLRGPNVRIYSTADAVTQDYVETRMNIVWDAKTYKIVRVTCG
ncbi:MAG: peptidase inhibitor I78 family protein [Proteobacteria bacterium]|nr:peptidase inhibitor I78 family protein [Pseudomonadota bacterium]